MRYSKVDAKTGKALPQIEDTVIIRTLPDDDADTSYLDQKEFEARKREYLNDQFGFIGVRVEVERHNWLTGNTHKWQSAGLWGVESDSDREHLVQIAQRCKGSTRNYGD